MTLALLLSYCFVACTLVCWLNVYRIRRDKAVQGVSVIPVIVFTITNLIQTVYFYQQLDWWNVAGSIGMFTGNAAWLFLYFIYQTGTANEQPSSNPL